jgi:hypothetical protein
MAAKAFQKFRKNYGKSFSIRTNFPSLEISREMSHDLEIEAFMFTKAVYTYYVHHQALKQHLNYVGKAQKWFRVF